MHVLIFGGHTCEFQKAHDFNVCFCFLLPVEVCIDVNFILAYVMIGSYVSRVSTYYTVSTLYKERHCHNKEMLVINKPAHFAGGFAIT